MIIPDTYIKVIKNIIMNNERIEIINQSDSLKAFIYVMQNNFGKYDECIRKIDLLSLEKDEIDYFYFIEGKIRYLYKTKYKEIFIKKNKILIEDLETLCHLALKKYEYSYNATYGLADIRFLQKKYPEALGLYCKLFDFGFNSEAVFDSIISISVVSRDWNIYEKYSNHFSSNKDKKILKIFFYEFKYFALLIPYTILCLTVPAMFGWRWALSFIIPINTLLIFISLIYRKRIFFSESGYFLIIFIISILFKLIFLK